MIPARFAPILFGFFVSMIMSFIISSVALFVTHGVGGPGFAGLWLRGWLTGWATAFPCILVVAPLARRIVARLTASGA